MNPVKRILWAMLRTAWSTNLLEDGQVGESCITITCGMTLGAIISDNLCVAKQFVQVNINIGLIQKITLNIAILMIITNQRIKQQSSTPRKRLQVGQMHTDV